MNRAERRKAARAGQPVKKEPVLQIKASALNQTAKQIRADAQKTAANAVIHEINRQILEHDRKYSLDLDAMILWTLHACYGWNKKRLEDFYEHMMTEHLRMREFYASDDTYPEQIKLKSECEVDIEALNQKFKDAAKTTTEPPPN